VLIIAQQQSRRPISRSSVSLPSTRSIDACDRAGYQAVTKLRFVAALDRCERFSNAQPVVSGADAGRTLELAAGTSHWDHQGRPTHVRVVVIRRHGPRSERDPRCDSSLGDDRRPTPWPFHRGHRRRANSQACCAIWRDRSSYGLGAKRNRTEVCKLVSASETSRFKECELPRGGDRDCRRRVRLLCSQEPRSTECGAANGHPLVRHCERE
jgi:hypothetical protein